jgi:hypothetical protein
LKPAWYSLERRGKLYDFMNLLHFPYTFWHLSYVLLGIALAPQIFLVRSGATLLAFFFGLGIGAHALDETMGNPLKTRLSKSVLYTIALSALIAAIAIGLYYVFTLSFALVAFVVLETFFALAYNLEMFHKKFHSTLIFALSWGSIPFLAGYYVNALTLTPAVLLVAIAVALLTFVQKTLSTQARLMRRSIASVDALRLTSGGHVPISSADLISPAEKSLKALTIMIFILAIALAIALH